jgi:hypothetical protein
MSAILFFPVYPESPDRDHKRHQLELDYSEIHDSAQNYSNQRSDECDPPVHQVSSSFPVGSGFSMSGAIARSYLESVDGRVAEFIRHHHQITTPNKIVFL